jgi:hypothetical protein
LFFHASSFFSSSVSPNCNWQDAIKNSRRPQQQQQQ